MSPASSTCRVNDLGIHFGVEHHGGPSTQHLVGVRAEEGDLPMQSGTGLVIADSPTECRSQSISIPDHFSAQVNGLLLSRTGRQQPDDIQHAKPDHSCISHQLEHDVLGKDTPSLTPSAL